MKNPPAADRQRKLYAKLDTIGVAHRDGTQPHLALVLLVERPKLDRPRVVSIEPCRRYGRPSWSSSGQNSCATYPSRANAGPPAADGQKLSTHRLHEDARNGLLYTEVSLEGVTTNVSTSPAYFFVVQIVTGTLLAFYYTATPEAAYDSVRYITHEVSYGW